MSRGGLCKGMSRGLCTGMSKGLCKGMLRGGYSQVANRRGGLNKRGVQKFFQNSINGGVLINGGG